LWFEDNNIIFLQKKGFEFERIFSGEDNTQNFIFEETALPLLKQVRLFAKMSNFDEHLLC
jgi:hypothetical protein